MRYKQLAIIVVNWNSYTLTNDTLESLYQTNYRDYDIVLVDNASTDDSVVQLKQNHSNIILLQNENNTGFTGGNNKGMQYALDHGYEYVLLLNNDVAVEKDFLEPLINALEENEKLGAVQPLIYFHHDRELVWNAGTQFNPWTGVTKTNGYEYKDQGQQLKTRELKLKTSYQKIEWITGCAFMVKTKALQKIGLLYEPFFIYYEDVDLSFRIKQAGYELGYVNSSVIYHIAGMSHKSSTKTAEGYISAKVHYLNARNHIWLLKKYTKLLYAPTVIIYQSAYYIGVGIYFILRGRWQKLKALYLGISEGLQQSITI